MHNIIQKNKTTIIQLIGVCLLTSSMGLHADAGIDLPDASLTDAIRGKTVQVTQAEIDLMYDAQPDASKMGQDVQTVTKAQIREILAQRVLLERGALEAALEEDNRVQLELDAARQLVLANAYERHLGEPERVTEEEIDAEYQTVLTQLAGWVYEMRRLTFREKDKALDAINALKDNQSFETVLEEHASYTPNITPSSWRWISASRMPPPVREEVERLSNNPGVDSVPVKVEKTWYVVQVRGQREAELPDKADIEQEMRNKIAQSKVHAWLRNRRLAEGL